MKPFIIRNAVPAHAKAISRLIRFTVRESNAKDYPPSVIDSVIEKFSPEFVSTYMAERLVLVATEDNDIVGTASLQGDVIYSVFVSPKHQKKGIGNALLDRIEQIAREKAIPLLTVPASITAEAFYFNRGYKAVRDAYNGEERNIIMEKRL